MLLIVPKQKIKRAKQIIYYSGNYTLIKFQMLILLVVVKIYSIKNLILLKLEAAILVSDVDTWIAEISSVEYLNKFKEEGHGTTARSPLYLELIFVVILFLS